MSEDGANELAHEMIGSSSSSSYCNGNEIFTEGFQATVRRKRGSLMKEQQLSQIYTFVCAIDFGSTYSGYAYAYVKQPDKIRVMKDISTSYSHTFYQKIPTVLLLGHDEEFIGFGYDAKQKYQKMDEKLARNYNYFDKFKMKLHYSKNINTDLLITASNGTFHNALKVFSLSLSYLKDLFFEEITNEFSSNISDEQIKWVLTVPSIWLEESKQFMRLAAYEAGLGCEQNPDQLQISLEPEAASLYCRSLRVRDCLLDECYYNKNSLNRKLGNEINFNKYIIMDCGGGTVDISVHELDLINHHIKELSVSTGGPVGGMAVDKKFEHIISVIFGENFIQKFKTKYPSNWLDILDNFDTQKRSLKAYSTDTVCIPLPYNMVKFFKSQKKQNLASYLKGKKHFGVSWSDQGALIMNYSLVKSMFTDAIESIKELITQLINRPELIDVKNCFLVGGFSNAFFLQNELRKHFSKELCIITPSDSSLSTLKGAVLFGLDNNTVRIRRSCYSYGIRCLKKFDESKHCSTKKIVIGNIAYCKDIFYTFVKVNDSIGYQDKIIKTFIKQSPTQTQSSFIIYRTKNINPFYVTDEGVEMCAKFVCDLSQTANSTIIQIMFYFGQTQINVKALDGDGNELSNSKLQFFSY